MSLAVAAFFALLAAAPGAGALRVRASAAVAPCVEAAVRAWPTGTAAVVVDGTGVLEPGRPTCSWRRAVE